MTQKTINSPVDEIHQTRLEISERFGGDIVAIAEDAASRLAASGRSIWQAKHDEQCVQPERRLGVDSAIPNRYPPPG